MKKLLLTFILLLMSAAVALATPTADTPFAGVHDPSSGSFFTDTLGYWHLDGTIFDETGSFNGTLTGNPQITDEGRVGRAYDFNGTTDYINIAGIVAEENVTFSAWAKSDATNCGSATINVLLGTGFSIPNGITISGSTCNRIVFKGNSSFSIDGVDATPSVFDHTEWNHFVGVSRTDGLFLYLNGVLIDSNTGSFVLVNISSDIHIGHAPTHATRYFNGTIDEVHIWNRSLNSSEVSQLYNMSKGDFALDVSDLGAAANESTGTKNIYNWFVNGTSIAVLNMPFEPSGTLNATDYSGFEGDALSVDATYDTTGGIGGSGAYSFDGNDDVINLNDTQFPTGDSDRTLSLWFKTTTTGRGTLFTYGTVSTGQRFEMQMDNTVACSVAGEVLIQTNGAGGTICSGTTHNDGEWHNAVATLSDGGNNLSFYVDGVLKGSIDPLSVINTVLGPLHHIGARNDLSFHYDGEVDEVMLFNRTLSTAQIQALFENKTSFIANEETQSCETWNASVTPNDATGDGTAKTTAGIPIGFFTGNNIQECSEQCDGIDLAGQTCEGLGHTGGTLSCTTGGTFDESLCTDTPVIPEFSTFGLLLTVIVIGLASVLIIRKKRQQ